jgi:hypothetical protein
VRAGGVLRPGPGLPAAPAGALPAGGGLHLGDI